MRRPRAWSVDEMIDWFRWLYVVTMVAAVVAGIYAVVGADPQTVKIERVVIYAAIVAIFSFILWRRRRS
jgi:hypothetical protein